MAGHSQFKNIMHRKGAQDARRAKVFTKIIREITISVKTGSADPSANPRLRAALVNARGANMSKDTLDRAIKKAQGAGDDTAYEEVRYEGYGPGGVAVIVETLTDNRNRTAGEVRAAFAKHGGALGETNSVSFQFERKGQVVYPAAAATAEAMFEAAVEAGAEDVESDAAAHTVLCAPGDFAGVRDALEAKFGGAQEASLAWRPTTTTPVDAETAPGLLKLIGVLEDNDDVQRVAANFEIAEDVLARLAS